MIRFLLLLFLSLAAAIIVTIYPEQAQGVVRLEAFGWQIETRQGPLLVGLVVLLGVWWLLQGFLSFLVSGPSKAWIRLKGRGQDKQWDKFADAISKWIDQRDDAGENFAKHGKHPGPEWLSELLETLTTAPEKLAELAQSDKPLQASLAARIATGSTGVPLDERQTLAQLWTKLSPSSPLAKERFIAIAMEAGQWNEAYNMLEDMWQKNRLRHSAAIQQQYLIVLQTLAQRSPEQASQYLRKAQQISPDDERTQLALGQAFIAQGDKDTAINTWYRDVEKNDHQTVAQALMPLLKPDAAKIYQRIRQMSAHAMSPAYQWLRACLARAAGETEAPFTHMDELLQTAPSALAWETLAQWQSEDGFSPQACESMQQALQQYTNNIPHPSETA